MFFFFSSQRVRALSNNLDKENEDESAPAARLEESFTIHLGLYNFSLGLFLFFFLHTRESEIPFYISLHNMNVLCLPITVINDFQ